LLVRTAPICACALLAVAAGRDASAEQWIDLTHPFNAESVYWPTAKMF
jgi:hypothetical protein